MTQNFQLARKASRAWLWLVIGGLVAIGAGISLGNSSAGPYCGSPFNPGVKDSISSLDFLPDLALDVMYMCEDSIADNTVLTWALIVAGLALAVAGWIIRANRPSHQAASGKLSQATPLQGQALSMQATATRHWTTAGVSSIALGALGLLVFFTLYLPAIGSGSTFLVILAGVAIAASLIAGIFAMKPRWRQERQLPIILIVSAGFTILLNLASAGFNVRTILTLGLGVTVIVATARAMSITKQKTPQKMQ